MKVLFRETMIKIYQDVCGVSYKQAQEELLEGKFEETEVPVGEVFIQKCVMCFLTNIHLLKNSLFV